MALNIGFVGAGNMGGAILKGFVASGSVLPENIYVSDHHLSKLDTLNESCDNKLNVYTDSIELLHEDLDVVILAIKPQVMSEFIKQAESLLDNKIVVSIAAGITLNTLEDLMPNSKVVRVMPNLPVAFCMGACAICSNADATTVSTIEDLFGVLGSAYTMTETQLDIEAAVVGCSPAFFALYIDAFTRAAIKQGMSAESARNMLLSTMQGTAYELLQTQEHPRSYMDTVTSPGGTTACALYAMESDVMNGAYNAIDAALKRTEELS